MTDRRALGDENFGRRLADSWAAQQAVAAHLEAHGCTVWLRPPVKATDHPEQGHEDIDLGVLYEGWTSVRRVEVKGRNLRFRSCADYPWPTAIVDEVEKFDSKVPAPWRYYLVNADLTCALVVPVASTREHWQRTTLADGAYRQRIPFYTVPVALCRAVPLDTNGSKPLA
jgi:hypothetical protein